MFKSGESSWAWWCTLVIPTLGRLRQEDGKLETSLATWQDPVSEKQKKSKKNHAGGQEYDLHHCTQKKFLQLILMLFKYLPTK
jgi:hypothetical protein